MVVRDPLILRLGAVRHLARGLFKRAYQQGVVLRVSQVQQDGLE